MTRHERLLEDLEDAYFALLMEEVAQREGERLEQVNRELLNDPAAAVPEELDRRCLKAIDRHFAGQRRGVTLRRTGKVLKFAAVIMLTAVLLFTTAFAASEKFRLATLNLMLTVTEEYARFKIVGNAGTPRQTAASSGKYFQNAEIGWIPDGFEYNESKSIDDTCIRFENDQGEFLYVFLHDADGATLYLDTENLDSLEHISINGNEGLCTIKYQEITIVLADLTHNLYIELGASIGVTVDTLKKVAENICIL